MTTQEKLKYIEALLKMAFYCINENGSYDKEIEFEYSVELHQEKEKSFWVNYKYISDFRRVPNYVDNSGIVEYYYREYKTESDHELFEDYENTENVFKTFEKLIENASAEYYNNTKNK